MTTGTEQYYAERAAEYDRVYAKPERQRDIEALGRVVTEELAGRDVLDVAAGTGFWTERYASAARSTEGASTATPDSALARARNRRRSSGRSMPPG